MSPSSTTKRLLALFLIAVVVSGGVYTVGTLRDTELGSVTVAAGNTGSSAGDSISNPVGVCAAGNSVCQFDMSTDGSPSDEQDVTDRQPSHSLLEANVAQDNIRLR